MPAKQPSLTRLKWALWAGALVIGVGVGAAIALLHQSSTAAAISSAAAPPVETWAAGVRRAPGFSLTNQHGKVVSLAALRGRPVIVTFIDPLCRNFCPREARVISEATKSFASQPAIVSVSVNPWADTSQNFHQDALHWRLAPQWQWGVGTQAQLAAVWKRYQIGVAVTKKTIAGITVRYITHTEAAYLVDGSGYERALFLYPFRSSDVVSALHTILAGSS